MKLRHVFGLLLAGLCFSLPVAARSYPAKPIRWLVPFPAGGAIGAEAAAKATPDGYTLLLLTTSSTEDSVQPRGRLHTDRLCGEFPANRAGA